MSKEQYSLGNISINEQGKQQTETITKDMSLLVINPNDETVFILSPLRRVAETIAPYFQKTFGYDILNDTKYQEIFDKYQQLRKEDKLATSTQRAKHIYQLKDNIYIDFRITQYAKDTIKEGEKTSK